MASPPFHFRKFSIEQDGAAHPVGTDGVLLGAWTDISACRKVLDIGTGTGVVALMLAQRLSDRPENEAFAITAVELHGPSAECARGNFARAPWCDQLILVESAIQEFAVPEAGQFDLIVSNPPYFSGQMRARDPVRRHGRHDETLTHEALLDCATRLMKPDGRFCGILPPEQGRKLCEAAMRKGLSCNQETEVYARPGKPVERLLLRFDNIPLPFERNKLVLMDGEGARSADFQVLVSNFYLK